MAYNREDKDFFVDKNEILRVKNRVLRGECQ